jgi:hypothetical protein
VNAVIGRVRACYRYGTTARSSRDIPAKSCHVLASWLRERKDQTRRRNVGDLGGDEPADLTKAF